MRLFCLPFLVLFSLLLALPAPGQQTTIKPVMPEGAPFLFAAMPSGEAGWKLTESRAKSDYTGGWMQVVLTRSWEGPPSASGVVPKIRITLTDTGGFPAFNGMFLAPGASHLTKLAGFPAIVDDSAEDGEKVFISIDGRFLLHVETAQMPRGSAEAWLKKVRTSDLRARAARGGEEKLPHPLPMFVVDEIHPKRNRAWVMAWTDAETLRKANEAGEP
jgi:hypothetical protein